MTRRRRRVITDLQRSGRVRVRVESADGTFDTLGTFEAGEAAAHAANLRAELERDEGHGPRTFREHGESWLTAREAAGVASIRVDRGRWLNHVARAPFFERELRAVRRADAKRFRDQLRTHDISPKTQREVLLLVRSVFADALEEQLVEANPFAGFRLPSAKTSKAFGWLYPDEDAALMACADVPVQCRIFYGVIAREGLRKEEALALVWSDLDLERGTLRLDENKSDDPRAWALGPDVVRTLRWWRDHELAHQRRVFVGERGWPVQTWRAHQLREHLLIAGVDRHELHVTEGKRVALRLHDLRASFVTVALAAGRSETWVTDRTGHRSHSMVARYKRAARTAAELGLGWWRPLDTLLPEMIRSVIRGGSKGGLDPARVALLGGLKTRGLRASRFDPGRGYSDSRITTPDPREVATRLLRAIHAGDGEEAFASAIELADVADARAASLSSTAEAVRAGDDHALLRALELVDALVPDVLGLDVAMDDEEGAG